MRPFSVPSSGTAGTVDALSSPPAGADEAKAEPGADDSTAVVPGTDTWSLSPSSSYNCRNVLRKNRLRVEGNFLRPLH